jgi:predicted nucleotidyltransferase
MFRDDLTTAILVTSPSSFQFCAHGPRRASAARVPGFRSDRVQTGGSARARCRRGPGGRVLSSGNLIRTRLSSMETWSPGTSSCQRILLPLCDSALPGTNPKSAAVGYHLAVFGPVARGDDRPDSDIDIAVEIEAGRSFSLIRMEETRLFLEDTLRRRVDLGEVDNLRSPARAAFEHERVPNLLMARGGRCLARRHLRRRR